MLRVCSIFVWAPFLLTLSLEDAAYREAALVLFLYLVLLQDDASTSPRNQSSSPFSHVYPIFIVYTTVARRDAEVGQRQRRARIGVDAAVRLGRKRGEGGVLRRVADVVSYPGGSPGSPLCTRSLSALLSRSLAHLRLTYAEALSRSVAWLDSVGNSTKSASGVVCTRGRGALFARMP